MKHNDRINLKHTKSYLSEEAAAKAVEKLLGSAEGAGSEYDLLVIYKEGRYVPVVKWNGKHAHRMLDSAHNGFYTIV